MTNLLFDLKEPAREREANLDKELSRGKLFLQSIKSIWKFISLRESSKPFAVSVIISYFILFLQIKSVEFMYVHNMPYKALITKKKLKSFGAKYLTSRFIIKYLPKVFLFKCQRHIVHSRRCNWTLNVNAFYTPFILP